MSASYLFVYAAVFALLFAQTSAKARSYFAPAPLWNVSWALLFFAGGALGGGYNYNSSNVLLLAGLAASFNIVPLLAPGPRSAEDAVTRTSMHEVLTSPNWLLILTGFISLAGAVQLSSALGNSLLSLDSASSILNAGQSNAAAIFKGEVVRGGFASLAYPIMQFGFAALGARLRLRPDRWAWTLLGFNLVTAALWTIVTTQRSYFLVEILWLIGGYVAAAVAARDERVSLRVFAWAMSAAAALAVFVVAARAVRVGGANAQLGSDAWSGAKLWVAGYIPTFSSWLDGGGGSQIYPLRLLSGVVSLLGGGIDTGTLADGEEFTYIGNGELSNASTMMRAAVLSGGVLGAFIVVVCLGALFTALYSSTRRGSPLATGLYAGAVATILWSINAWHFTIGNRVIAQVLICLAVLWSARVHRQRSARTQARSSPYRSSRITPRT